MGRISKITFFGLLWIAVIFGQTYYRAIIFYNDISDISSYLNNQEIDVVHNYERNTKHVDVYVSTSYYTTLENAGLNIVLTAATVDEGHKSYILGSRWDAQYGYYPKYGQFDSLLAYYETTYPNIAKSGVLPVKSHYGRDILYMKISNSPDSDNKKPEVCIQGVIHGNEPIGAGIVRDGIEYLCENYTKDPEIKWIVDNRQICFLPVMNVERYIWNENQSTTGTRQRRTMDYKNGNSSNSESAGGVDPNRNFPYKWAFDNSGSSSTPTAMNYRGAQAADQKCVQAVIEFFKAHTFRFWNVYHSAGEKVLIPFGHTENLALSSYDSTSYYSVYHEWRKFYPDFDGCGTSWEYYFPINGSTEDWAWYSDDTTSKVYGYITELGPGTSGAYWFTDAISEEMCRKMVQCDIFIAKAAGFYPVLDEVRIDDPPSGGGNNDGILNPGETVSLYVKIKNLSSVDTTNVTAYLCTPDPLIQMNDSTGSYGDVEHVETVENSSDPFAFKCAGNASQGTRIPFIVRVTWNMNSVDFEKALLCTLEVGPYTDIVTNQMQPKNIGLSIVRNRASRTIRFKLSLPQGFSLNNSREIVINIYEPSGRIIRTIGHTAFQPYSLITWDGTSNSGTHVKAGVYFIEAVVNGSRVSKEFVFVQ